MRRLAQAAVVLKVAKLGATGFGFRNVSGLSSLARPSRAQTPRVLRDPGFAIRSFEAATRCSRSRRLRPMCLPPRSVSPSDSFGHDRAWRRRNWIRNAFGGSAAVNVGSAAGSSSTADGAVTASSAAWLTSSPDDNRGDALPVSRCFGAIRLACASACFRASLDAKSPISRPPLHISAQFFRGARATMRACPPSLSRPSRWPRGRAGQDMT